MAIFAKFVVYEAVGTCQALAGGALRQTAGTVGFIAQLADVDAAGTEILLTMGAIAGTLEADRLFTLIAAGVFVVIHK